MFPAHHRMAVVGWQFQRYAAPPSANQAGVAGGVRFFFHALTVANRCTGANPQSEGAVIGMTMNKTTASHKSAEPIKGLSARGQKLIAPRAFGQMPRPITPRNLPDTIPQALRSNSIRG